MNNIWTSIVNWFKSKGGVAHVIAGVFVLGVAAYAQVPQFAAALNELYNSMPAWVHQWALVLVALYAWYKNTGKGQINLNGSQGKLPLWAIVAFLLAASAVCVAGQTPVPTPAGFVASSDALAINVNGTWGVGNLTTESYDFLDYGAAKSSRIFLQGVELSAPSASFSVFGGGVMWQPDISSLLAKTNLPAGNFVVFVDGSAGDGIPASGGNRVSAIMGAGLKYILSDNITWNSVRFEEVFFGSSRYPAISTGLSAYFGGTPASAAKSSNVRASLLKHLAKARTQLR